MELDLLAAGAAKGLVAALETAFGDATGAAIRGTFGAVGAIRERLLEGSPCDLLILTGAMLDDLARAGLVDGATIAPLGRVRTGVAVRAGDPRPAIGDRDALSAAFVNADAIYLPDPERATAGIHFMKVLRALGIDQSVAARLRPHPNGAAAMAALAATKDVRPIGCTQSTEILYTPGVALVGVLPAEFELATVYSAGISTGARHPELAARLLALLTSEASAPLRTKGGFER